MDTKKIAIVTGASSGIGKEFVALMLKEEIDELWAIGLNEDRLKEVKETDKDRVRVFAMDLTQRKNLDILEALIISESVDIKWLINCAGYAKFCDYGGIDRYTSINMIDLNVSALVAMGLICLPYMQKGGHIVNMASQASFQPLPYQNIYSSTKAFVRNYTRALNVELKSKGVVATAVCPGWMQTRLIERAIVKGEKGTRVFPHIVYPDVVAKKAIKDAKKSKDISIYGLYAKLSHIVAKILPQKCMMGIWLRQQRLKSVSNDKN
ncbi:MAG: SDR family NAD(P)-dependent oxidoreductase [Clostridia bacterium]|nr:SDR family NAD(P)-dependent oxidoreductase [Clostridia bacterium]